MMLAVGGFLFIFAFSGLIGLAFVTFVLHAGAHRFMEKLHEFFRPANDGVDLCVQQNQQIMQSLEQIRNRLINIEACLNLDNPYHGA